MNLEFFFSALTSAWGVGEILLAVFTQTRPGAGKIQGRGTQIILWVVIIASFKIEEWMHSFFAVDMPGSYSWLLIAMMVGVVAETRYLGRPFATADNVLFLCVIFWPQQFCVCESEFNPWLGP
jgi:hypothetical protein